MKELLLMKKLDGNLYRVRRRDEGFERYFLRGWTTHLAPEGRMFPIFTIVPNKWEPCLPMTLDKDMAREAVRILRDQGWDVGIVHIKKKQV